MNAPVVVHPATLKAEIRAFARLAHTQSRIAVQRANWAREALLQGKADVAAKYASEAAAKRLDALWHLKHARMRKGERK